jgi:hypothetical protein
MIRERFGAIAKRPAIVVVAIVAVLLVLSLVRTILALVVVGAYVAAWIGAVSGLRGPSRSTRRQAAVVIAALIWVTAWGAAGVWLFFVALEEGAILGGTARSSSGVPAVVLAVAGPVIGLIAGGILLRGAGPPE